MTTSATRISAVSRVSAGASLPPPEWVFRMLKGAKVSNPSQSGGMEIQSRRRDERGLISVRCRDAGELCTEEFRAMTIAAYDAIGGQARGMNLPYPIRFWNHIPSIHAPAEEGTDRYMVFNAGRFEALCRWFGGEKEFARLVPTATGVGHGGNDLIIHCLVAKEPGVAIANPRQVAPYHYSRRFGPLPPCFARATLVETQPGEAPLILVGGTASVRGEDSVFADDLSHQAHETLANLASVIRAALGENVVEISDPCPWLNRLREVRIYFPRAEHQRQIQMVGRGAFAAAGEIEVIQADLCRKELLIEIEGVAR